MSGAVVVTPSTGAAWSTAWEQFEGIRKGLISLSLTNYDATTVPQIASGSWIEAAGSIYKWTSNDTITGTPSANAINYITLVPSGTGASAILTPTWASGAPTWSDAYQGYYSGTTRYAGGCYYDATNYPLKWVYLNRHAGPITKYETPALVGTTNSAAEFTLEGDRVTYVDADTADYAWVNLDLPDGVLITGFYSYCQSYTDSDAIVHLVRSITTGVTWDTMATNTHTGTGAITDTTITTPIASTDYMYAALFQGGTDTSAVVSGVRVIYIEVRR